MNTRIKEIFIMCAVVIPICVINTLLDWKDGRVINPVETLLAGIVVMAAIYAFIFWCTSKDKMFILIGVAVLLIILLIILYIVKLKSSAEVTEIPPRSTLTQCIVAFGDLANGAISSIRGSNYRNERKN